MTIVLLVVVFQPELRHALLRLDSMVRLGFHPLAALNPSYRVISEAAFTLAQERTGALIVVAGRDSIRELLEGGIALGGEISAEILEAIFRKTSPLHDGAVTVEADRISRAGVILPLTQREDVPHQFGTRHRAGMGLAERCDALVIVISEERGEVTLMHGRRIIPIDSPARLLRLFEEVQAPQRAHLGARVWRWLSANLRFKLAAVGLASLIWGMSFLGTGTTVKTVGVTGLVARFDLSKAGEGSYTLRIGPDSLNLPPGVTVEQVSPHTITLRIARRSP